jgi:cyclohexadieny/prephenate dehydrogenase
MWRDVFLTNKDATLEILGRFTEELFALQRAIRMGDGDHLHAYFTRTGLSAGVSSRRGRTPPPGFRPRRPVRPARRSTRAIPAWCWRRCLRLTCRPRPKR